MGYYFEYECSHCRYSCNVAGGETSGDTVKTRTVWCSKYRELRDVVVAKFDGLILVNDMYEPIWEDVLMTCSKNPVHNIAFWTDGDPCPRCGGSIKRTSAPAIMWY